MSKTEIIKKLKSKKVKDYLSKNGIIHLSLFGSYAKENQNETSDIDLLYEQNPNIRLGRDFFEIISFLEKTLGKEVELIEKSQINTRIKEKIIQEKIDII